MKVRKMFMWWDVLRISIHSHPTVIALIVVLAEIMNVDKKLPIISDGGKR